MKHNSLIPHISAQYFSRIMMASVIASQLFLSPIALAQSLPFGQATQQDNRNSKLHERLIRKKIKAPVITTRSIIDLPRNVNGAEFRISSKDNRPLNILINKRQKITQREGRTIQLQVRKYLPSDTLQEFPFSAEQRFLKSGPFIDYKKGSVSIKAKQLIEGEIYAYQAGKILQKWVYDHIQTEKEYDSPKTASQTLSSRSGSAIEKALLLAAMYRAIGIPAKIASGIEFRELGDTGIGSFQYHTWTESYIGEWVPFDPSHEDFLVDATHIKLADSAYSSPDSPQVLLNYLKQQMARMEIEVLRAEAQGSTEISLTGRAVENARLQPPQIDILQIDIQKRTKDSTHKFTLTPTDNILNLKPNESLFTYATERLLEGNINEARKIFRELSDNRLSLSIEHYSLGEKLAGLGMFGLAMHEFKKAEAQNPALSPNIKNWQREYFPSRPLSRSAENTYLLAISTAAMGADANTTEALLKKSKKNARSFALADLQLGQLYFSEGRLGQAQTAYEQFKRLRPNDPRGYQGAGLLLMEQGQYGQALNEFKMAKNKVSLYHSPQSTRLRRDIENWLLMAKGRSIVESERGSAAEKSAAWLEIGQALFEQGQLRKARTAYINARVFLPEDPLAQLSLLELYLSLGEKSKTITLFEELNKAQFPKAEQQSRFHGLQGYNHMRNRFYPKAKKALNQAIAEDPSNVENYLTLAQVYHRTNEKQKAITQLEAGIKQVRLLNDKNKLRYALAQKLMDGQAEKAKIILNELLLDDPSNPENYHLLGKIALNKGDLSEAQSRFFQSYLLDPDDPNNLTDLAYLYDQENRLADAMSYYQRALRIDPGNYQAATLLKELIEAHDFRVERPERIIRLSTDEYDYLVDFIAFGNEALLQVEESYEKLGELLQGYSTKNVENIRARRYSIPILQDHYDLIVSGIQRLEDISPPGRFNQLHYQVANVYQGDLKFLKILQENVPLLLSDKQHEAFVKKSTQQALRNRQVSEGYDATMIKIFKTMDPIQRSAIFMEAGSKTDSLKRAAMPNFEKFISIIYGPSKEGKDAKPHAKGKAKGKTAQPKGRPAAAKPSSGTPKLPAPKLPSPKIPAPPKG